MSELTRSTTTRKKIILLKNNRIVRSHVAIAISLNKKEVLVTRQHKK